MTNKVRSIVIPDEQIEIWDNVLVLVKDSVELKKESASKYGASVREACEVLIETIINNVDGNKLTKKDLSKMTLEEKHKHFSTVNIPTANDLRLPALTLCALASWLPVTKNKSATWWKLFEREVDFIKININETNIITIDYDAWTFQIIPTILDEYVAIKTCIMGVFSSGHYVMGLPVVVPEVELETTT